MSEIASKGKTGLQHVGPRQSDIQACARKELANTEATTRALNDISPELVPIYHELADLSHKIVSNVVLYHFQVGQRLRSVLDRHQRAGQAALLRALNMSTDTAHKCGQIFEQFKTVANLQQYLNLHRPDGSSLSVTHFVSLASLSTDAERLEFAKKAALEDMSADELARAVIDHCGGKRSQGGRSIRPPETLSRCIQFMQADITNWLKRHGVAANFLNTLDTDLPDEEATPELFGQITLAAEQAESLAESARVEADRLRRMADTIERKLDASASKEADYEEVTYAEPVHTESDSVPEEDIAPEALKVNRRPPGRRRTS